jgi:hypothetical protein
VSRVYDEVLAALPRGEREAFLDSLGRLAEGPLASRRTSSHGR